MKIVVGAKMANKEPDAAALKETVPEITKQIRNLEKIVKDSKGPYLTGPNLTIADIQVYYQCTSEFFWERDFKAYPHIDAWMKKMMEVKEVKEIMDGFMAFVNAMNAEKHFKK